MALNGQYTENFEFYKPSLEDSPPDITSTNENWEIIDEQLMHIYTRALPLNINQKLPSVVASTEIKDIYLSPNGNDNNGGTIPSQPLKTIRRAISHYGGTARLVLHLASGTYTESNVIEVSGCTSVEMMAEDSAVPVVRWAYTQHGGYFTANGIQFTAASSSDILTFNGVCVNIDNCTFSNGVSAIVFRNGTTGFVSNTQISNATRAIWALNGSYVAAHNITGEGNGEGYRTTAGIITVGTSTLTATTLASKYGGGVIFRGGNLFGSTANTFVNAT